MSFCHLQQQQASETNTQQITPSERRKQIKQLLHFSLNFPQSQACWLMNVCDNKDARFVRKCVSTSKVYNLQLLQLCTPLCSPKQPALFFKVCFSNVLHILKLFLSNNNKKKNHSKSMIYDAASHFVIFFLTLQFSYAMKTRN